ncbi:protocatechuate 3,4-dioxygenase subunit alpha [Saxibacter everestensis]|uniref:Protocatechuate 3,4-dioxygenase subunit alpha n=1 Tax=Saxibacter everestensis TaxID=2909229 RepID=A0ABY8QUJ2_9MICO|nr:protocatechuate 3,4-dioxygenase subunit alpha [Brevibacteriaceae bacterium ZFBP1038]
MSDSQMSDGRPMPRSQQTPAQTVGPFFGYALPYPGGEQLVAAHRPDAIRVHGTVYDGDRQPVPDALVEIWQPDGAGRISRERGSLRRDGYTFTGFGRAAADGDGHYQFTTVKPGATGGSAPYVLLTIFARGLLHHLFTRMYFPDEDANQADRLLARLEPERRSTLIGVADADRSYRFDVHLQGEQETVFLDFDD